MPNKQRLQIKWLRLALQDMAEIATYLAQEDAATARLVVERIWQGGQSLNFSPDRGRPGRVPGTRELILNNVPYFLAYRVKAKSVQILRIIHTARNWPQQ